MTDADPSTILQGLRGRAKIGDTVRIAGLGDDLPVLHRNGVDTVQRLDDAAAGYLDLDRIGHCRNTRDECRSYPK